MSILEKTQVGNSVKVNLEQTKDRLNKEIIDIINISSIGTIKDFRITDGKGIGVILILCNGQEQWFFESEIDILDKNGNIIKEEVKKGSENKNFFIKIIENLRYEKKSTIKDLINPINFMFWVIVSFKDNF